MRPTITFLASAALVCGSAVAAFAQDRTIPSNDVLEQTPPIDVRPWQTLDRPKGEVIIQEGRTVYVPNPPALVGVPDRE